MALKFKYKSKDEIPTEHQTLYVERDGAFVLDAEGAVDGEDMERKIASLEPERNTARARVNRALVSEKLQPASAWQTRNTYFGRSWPLLTGHERP